MINYWKSLSGNTKFSILGFFIVAGLGLLSMGLLGLLLYYPVGFLLSSYPAFNDWHGDWVWPVLIGVGMFWSIGFILAGITVHFFKRVNESIIIQLLLYTLILWLWDAILWLIVLSNQNWE